MAGSPPGPLNIADRFLGDRLREGRGDRPAILCGERRISYAELEGRASRFAHLLREIDVRPEERVMLALADGPDFAGALFGILKAGSVAVPVNPYLKPEGIRDLYDYVGPRCVLAGTEFLPAFRDAASGLPAPADVVAVGHGEGSFDADNTILPGTFETLPCHRDDPAIWLFSGGTTGRPKGVVQTHRSFANSADCYAAQAIGYREGDVTLSVPKLFFGYATGSNLFFPLAAGGTSILFPERAEPEVIFDSIERHRPTILVNVPTMIHRMVEHPDAGTRDLSSLRLVTSAGEALPRDLHRRWMEMFGVELLDGLGTAEMWHIFVSNRPGDVRPGTLGKVVPGFEIDVRDPDGASLPDGEPGALWVRGDSRAIGYWRDLDRTREVFRGEWVVTGDTVVRDAEGYVSYVGRADELMKIKGRWLAPAEVEDRLLTHPAVRECAVVGIEDATGLVRPRAYVVPADGADRDGLAERLRAFVREGLDSYKVPDEVLFLDTMPRTHLGKIDRGGLRRRTAEGGA